MEINYAAECAKLVEELENSNPNIKFEWWHEGENLLYLTINVRDKKCSRYLTGFPTMYCWLDALKVGLQTSALIIAQNGTIFFD